MKKGLVLTIAFIILLLGLFYAALLANPPAPEHSEEEHTALSLRPLA